MSFHHSNSTPDYTSSLELKKAREACELVTELSKVMLANIQYLRMKIAFLEEDRKSARQSCGAIVQSSVKPNITCDFPEDFQLSLFQLDQHLLDGMKYIEQIPGAAFCHYEDYINCYDALQSLYSLIQTYATSFPKHWAILSDKGPVHRTKLIVEGAGVKEANGIYRFTENFNGAGSYSLKGEYQGKRAIFSVYRTQHAADNSFTWYLKRSATQQNVEQFPRPDPFQSSRSGSFKYTLLYEGSSTSPFFPPENTWSKISSQSTTSDDPIPTVTIAKIEEAENTAATIIKSEDQSDDDEVEYVK